MPATPRFAPLLALSLVLAAAPAVDAAPPDRLPTATVSAAVDGLGLADIDWLRRDGFGLDSATLARYRQLGRVRFLDEQLAGDDRLPPAVAAQIRALPVLATPLPELLADFHARQQQYKDTPAGPAKDAAKQAFGAYRREFVEQAAQAELLHAIHGGNQLKEQLVWFWLNHFSVYADKGPVRVFAADYAERVIRPHALGKFRDLVMATLQSPAMLVFLDNARNASDKTNENYARELMELHTLGVGAGYSQADVQQLMRVLTGAGLQLQPPRRFARPGRGRPGVVRDGLFVFDPQRHDFGDKILLGQTIRGRGYAEIGQAVDLIVHQPACAHFISQRLAEYFIADRPAPALVDAMADSFRRSDGDIAAVLRTMLLSKEAAAPDPRKFKDPMRFVVSSLRLAYDGQPVPNTAPLANWLQQMGEPLYGRVTPDGWPLDSASWTGSGQLGKRFDFAGVIGSGRNRLFAADGGDTPPQPPGPPALRDSALYRDAIAPRLSEATRHALAQAKSPAEWNTFLLSSPDFNYR